MGAAELCRGGEDKVGPELVSVSGRPPVQRRPYSDSEAMAGLSHPPASSVRSQPDAASPATPGPWRHPQSLPHGLR